MCGFSGTHFRLAVFCLVIASHDIRLANGCIHDEVDVDGGSYRSTDPVVEYIPTFALPGQVDLKPQSHGHHSLSRGPFQDVSHGSAYVQTFKPVQQSQKPFIDDWQQQETSKSVQQNQQPSLSKWKTRFLASQQARYESTQQNPNVATGNSKPQTFGSSQTIYRRTGQRNFLPSQTNQNQDGGSYRSTYPAVESMPTFASPGQVDLKPQYHSHHSLSRGPFQDVSHGSVYAQTFEPVRPSQKPSIDYWRQQETSKSVQQIQRPSTNNWQQQGTSKSVQQNQKPSLSNGKTQFTASQQAPYESTRQNPYVATGNLKPQTLGSSQTIYRRTGQGNFLPSQTNQNQDGGSYRSTYPAVEPTSASPGQVDSKPQYHGHSSLSRGPFQDVNHGSAYAQTFEPVRLSQKPSINNWQGTSKSVQQSQQPPLSNWKTQSTALQQATHEPKLQNLNVATSNSKTQSFGSSQNIYRRAQSKETSIDDMKQQVSGSSHNGYKPVQRNLQPSFHRGPESVQRHQRKSFDGSKEQTAGSVTSSRSSQLHQPQSLNNWQQVSGYVTQSKGASSDSWKQQASGSSENVYKPVQRNQWPYIINRKSQPSESVSPTYKPVQNQEKSSNNWKQQASGSSQNAHKPVQKIQWLDGSRTDLGQFLGSSQETSKQQKRHRPIYGSWVPLDSRPPLISESAEDDLQQSSFDGWKMQESSAPSIPDQSICERCQFKLDMSLVPLTQSGNRWSQNTNTHQDLLDQEDPNHYSALLDSHAEVSVPLAYPSESGNTHQDLFHDQEDSTLYNHGEASGPLAYLGEIKG
ncbi:uncharacterized protein LOC134463972 [Engraulis encrasicolus]|uniref:uncharacterized protein LOC134463972 n=1 Tax=Engraulis encrasicolus TaxID=184585 RepID=UPI002FD4E8F0